MHRKAFLALGVLACLSTAAQATATFTAGNHILLPNTPGQKIQVMVVSTPDGGWINGQTTDITAGISLRVSVGDAILPVNEPIITGVDVITGTIFAPNNNGQTPTFPEGGARGFAGTATVAGTVAIPLVSSLAGTVTIDTTGFNSGVFPFRARWVNKVPNSNSSYTGTGGQFEFPVVVMIDGSITIEEIPEPASVVLGLFAMAGLGAVAIRRRRARKA